MKNNKTIKSIIDEWTGKMPFNNLLGFHFVSVEAESAELKFTWQDNFIGNPLQSILHGGVISSALDTVGGIAAAANMISKFDSEKANITNINKRLSTLGTINMRTDYLMPGRGKTFVATARIIRSGNKVVVTRMELHNETYDHIAYGTGTYIVG